MAMPTESFLFWPPLRFLAWAVMIFSKSRSFSTRVTWKKKRRTEFSWLLKRTDIHVFIGVT